MMTAGRLIYACDMENSCGIGSARPAITGGRRSRRRRVLSGVCLAIGTGLIVRVLTSIVIDDSLAKVLVGLWLESALAWLGAPDPMLGGRMLFRLTTRDVATQITDVATASLSFFACLLVYQLCVFRWPRDSLPRCGTCNYILSGITQPRCPECGTPL